MKPKKKKKTSSRAAPSRSRVARKLTPNENEAMKRRARRRPEIETNEVAPALDVTLPIAHAGSGHLVAETFLERNGAGILDIVVPAGAEVTSWCCFARPARGKSRDWVVVSNHPDEHGRFRVPVPKTHLYVWGFGDAPADAEDGERIWRLHGHNVAFSGVGRDICWRLVLRLAPVTVPVRTSRRLPRRSSRAKKTAPRPAASVEPVTIPVPA